MATHHSSPSEWLSQELAAILHSQAVTMENQCQDLLVKSVCAFHYQTTVQLRAFTIQQFNRPFFFSSLGPARPLLLSSPDCDFPKMQRRSEGMSKGSDAAQAEIAPQS